MKNINCQKIINFEWKNIENICIDFCNKNINKFDCIVAVTRGGWIPSVIISHRLNIRLVYPFQIYETVSDKINAVKEYPKIGANINFKILKNKKILIVDDIFGSGETLEKVVKYLKKYSNNLVSFVCVLNEENYKGKYKLPDFVGEKIKGWAVFPWEVK